MDRRPEHLRQALSPCITDEPLLALVSNGFETFTHLQALRLQSPGTIAPSYPRWQWSNSYMDVMWHYLGEDVALVRNVWGFANFVIKMGEIDVQSHGHDACCVPDFLEWNRQVNLNVDFEAEVEASLHSDELPNNEFWLNFWTVVIYRAFHGDLQRCGNLIAVGFEKCSMICRFNSDENSVLADCVDMLQRAPQRSDAANIEHWRGNMDIAIREVANMQFAQTDPASGMFHANLVDVLLLAKGDATFIAELIQTHDMGPMWHLAALAALVHPNLTLHELAKLSKHVVPSTPVVSIDGDDISSVALNLLATQTPCDMIRVLNEFDAAVSAKGNTRLGFAASFATAHIADVCVTATALAKNTVAGCFERDIAVFRYVEHLLYTPGLWKVAATYCVYSPLMDRQLLALVFDRVQGLVVDGGGEMLCDMMQFYRSHVDPESEVQVTLRSCLHGVSAVLNVEAILASGDGIVQDAYDSLIEGVANAAFALGDYAQGLQLCIDMKRYEDARQALARWWRTENIAAILAVADALEYEFIVFDKAIPEKLQTLILGCEAYRNSTVAVADDSLDDGSRLHALMAMLAVEIPLPDSTVRSLVAAVLGLRGVRLTAKDALLLNAQVGRLNLAEDDPMRWDVPQLVASGRVAL